MTVIPDPADALLTVNEAADRLRVSRDHIIKHVSVIRIGKRILVRKTDIDALVAGEVK